MYTSFGTISLLNKDGNVTNQYYHRVDYSGRFVVAEYHKTRQWRVAKHLLENLAMDIPTPLGKLFNVWR